MKRREFIAAALGSAAVTWRQSARAQQSAAPVIGLLASGLEAQSPHLIGFSKGLSETGFVEGRNVGIQYRFAEGHYDRLPAMVAELVNRHVAVLAASGGVQTALAVKAANTSIPLFLRTAATLCSLAWLRASIDLAAT